MKSLTYVEIDVPEFSDVDSGEKEVVPGLEFDFETNSLLGWTASEETVTATANGMTVVATGDDPQMRCAAGQTINGATQRYIRIDVERTAVRTIGVWQGSVFYTTDGHAEVGSFTNSFPELENIIGAREVFEVDMHDLDAGGTDWADNTITRFRVDFEDGQTGAVTPNGHFLVHSIIVGEREQTFRFAKPVDYLPRDIDAIPSITGCSFTPATISLGQNLGERATFTANLQDHRHIMNGESFDSGTFWGKWRARYGTRLRGRAVRWITGLEGQSFDQMEVRHFVIESTEGPTTDGTYTIQAKDILKLADDDRSQAPLLSNGFLVAAIDADDTAFTLSPAGIGNAEYPASGHVAIGGEEIVSFTRSGNVMTITRGQLGTVGVAHDAGDRAQIVLRYVGKDPADIISDLLITYAGLPADYISLSSWLNETGAFLQRVYTANIAEPTGVNKLVSELIEQAALAMWWDDLGQSIRLQVLRPVATNAAMFSEDNTLENSLKSKEQPGKRVSQVWTYFAQRNPLRPVDEPDNYRSTAITADLEAETDYGGAVIKKIFSRWIPAGGRPVATKLNDLLLGRFVDAPRQFTFDVFRYGSENPQLGAGYQLGSWTLQDITGAAVNAPIQITRLNPTEDRFTIEAEEVLFTAGDQPDLTNRVIIIDSGIDNVNLREMHDSLYPEVTGSESPEVIVTCIVEAGVIVGSSSTSGRAFDVGSWPAGVTLNLVVNGRIQGTGGNGGGSTPSGPGNGVGGGTALYTRVDINLDVDEGQIWGGGGGGVGRRHLGAGSYYLAGGGGGAGTVPGLAGIANKGGSSGFDEDGFPGTSEAGGAGGFVTQTSPDTNGGVGGGPGQAGGAGTGPSGGGSPGAAGRAIDGISFVTVTEGPGDRRGPEIN